MRAPEKNQGRRIATAGHFRPAERSYHARSAAGRKYRSPASTAIRSAWENSALAPMKRAQELAHGSAARLVCVRRQHRREGNRSAGPAIGPARSSGISPRAHAVTARIRSSSNRRFRIIGRKRRSSAIPKRSCCRGSPICDGAATRWCWNRRAPARCSGFAIRRSRPPSLRLSTPQNDQPVPAAGRLSGGRAARIAGGLPDPVQGRRCRRRRPARRPRATTTSCSGIFTICCSTPTAPKAGRPIRWADFIPMPG